MTDNTASPNLGGLAAKLRAIKERDAAAAAEKRKELNDVAEAAVARANEAAKAAQASDPHFVRDGVANIPANWWGAERERMVEAVGPEVVEEFNSNMRALLEAPRADVATASARLQTMLRSFPGSEILINPAIMRAIVEKLQMGYTAARQASIQRQSNAATRKIATANAAETLNSLLGDF